MSGLIPQSPLLATFLLLLACTTVQQAMAPALPTDGAAPPAHAIPESVLSEAIRRGDLIVLATAVEMASNHGFLTPRFQLGAKETWYDVKLTVDSVLKGKLKHAKRPDLGMLPVVLAPGEQAIFIFRRCYYCMPISGVAHGRGAYYKANPLVAVGLGSKLPPSEWGRLVRLANR